MWLVRNYTLTGRMFTRDYGLLQSLNPFHDVRVHDEGVYLYKHLLFELFFYFLLLSSPQDSSLPCSMSQILRVSQLPTNLQILETVPSASGNTTIAFACAYLTLLVTKKERSTAIPTDTKYFCLSFISIFDGQLLTCDVWVSNIIAWSRLSCYTIV